MAVEAAQLVRDELNKLFPTPEYKMVEDFLK